MEKRTFATPQGEVWLWGEPAAFEGDGLAIVILTGAFAGPTVLRVMAELIPETPLLIGDVPGNNCPRLREQSVDAYRAAYGAAIAGLGRPVTLCGSSLGATIALGVRAPNVRALLALEPVLRGEAAAPLWPGFRGALRDRPQDADLREMLWNVFGVDETHAEPRDYRAALEDLSVPTTVLAGVFERFPPSLLSYDDRLLLKAHPQVRLRTVLGVGHDIGAGGTSIIVQSLREMSAAAAT
ncbi:MAG: alpha/beta fold hydrolase [Phenylobacterium sp.]